MSSPSVGIPGTTEEKACRHHHRRDVFGRCPLGAATAPRLCSLRPALPPRFQRLAAGSLFTYLLRPLYPRLTYKGGGVFCSFLFVASSALRCEDSPAILRKCRGISWRSQPASQPRPSFPNSRPTGGDFIHCFFFSRATWTLRLERPQKARLGPAPSLGAAHPLETTPGRPGHPVTSPFSNRLSVRRGG